MTHGTAPTVGVVASRREGRLWLLVGLVVATIYSTLGLARVLAAELRTRELFDTMFVVGFLLIWVAIGAVALRVRPGGAEIGVGLGIAAVYVMVFARMGIPEERTHLFEYSVVALLIYEALIERNSHGRRVRAPALVAFGAASLVGILDEVIQGVMPSRVFDVRDIGFNTLASAMAVGAATALRRVRRRRVST